MMQDLVCDTMAGRRARRAAGVLAAALAPMLILAHGALAARPRGHRPQPQQPFSVFPVKAVKSGLASVAVGRGGNVWFTERFAAKIGRVSPAGKVSEVHIPSNEPAYQITAAGGGVMYFTEHEAGRIGRVTPSGKISEFQIPTPASAPNAITLGPDGNLWFTEGRADKVARMTPSGSFTEFQVPTPASAPAGITAGPGGEVWFTEARADKLGRISPAGTITELQIPVPGFPTEITEGREGNLWFTDPTRIVRVTPAGVFTAFPVPVHTFPPTSLSGPITVAPDGNLWFTEGLDNRISRITPSGAITNYYVPPVRIFEASPDGIAAEANGDLWFTESNGDVIGRLRPKLLRCVVPELKGKSLVQARTMLAQAQCTLGRVNKSTRGRRNPVVVNQSPPAHKTLPYGANVSVRLA